MLLWSTAVYTQACQKGLAPAADRVAQDAAEVRAERTRDPGLDHVYAPNQECDRTCQVHQGQGLCSSGVLRAERSLRVPLIRHLSLERHAAICSAFADRLQLTPPDGNRHADAQGGPPEIFYERTRRKLCLRTAADPLRGRTEARFNAPLRRLPAPNWQRARHRRLFEGSAVEVIRGRSKTFTRNSVVGKLATFHFCPECGSTVFWKPERMPQL